MSIFTGLIDKAMGVCNRFFGDPIVYFMKEEPSVGLNLTGIFEAEGMVIDTSGEVPVETRHPVLSIRKSDFTNAGHRLPKKGDKVTIGSKDYEVTGIPDDGWSEMRLVLMKKGTKTYA